MSKVVDEQSDEQNDVPHLSLRLSVRLLTKFQVSRTKEACATVYQ